MKNQKNKKRIFIWLAVIAVVFIIVFLIISGVIIYKIFTSPDKTTNQTDNTINIYTDENFSDVHNLKKIHLANVYVINGNLYKEIIDESRGFELGLLEKTLEEIKGNETLFLMIEPKLGLLQGIEIYKNDSNYIYAVADYLGNYFHTETVYTQYIPKEILSGANCSNLYDAIDTDLQNANHCTVNSDCKTLPLGSMYIEFGCYHYINKDENSTEFYQRMNFYSAECGNIIDLCSPTPEAKCVDGKCEEAE